MHNTHDGSLDWTRRAVSEVMTRDLVSVAAGEAMAEVRRVLERTAFHHLPVIDDGRLLGMISVSDLPLSVVLESSPHGRGCLARDVMRPPLTVPPERSLAEAAQQMLERRVGSLAVVAASGQLLGLVTRTDLLRTLAKHGK